MNHYSFQFVHGFVRFCELESFFIEERVQVELEWKFEPVVDLFALPGGVVKLDTVE